MLTTVIKPNTYQDSVSLMLLSQQLTGLDGVNKVSVMMGTPANKDILRATGFSSPELDAAAPGDMVLGMDLADGTEVTGFLCEGHALAGAPEITHHGGWRAYLESRN